MSKPKAPDLPATPTYFDDPRFQQGINQLLGLGGRLTDFDLTGTLEPLKATTEINPDVVSGFFQSLQPQINQLRRGTVNELAATNQLESSVTANRLGQIDTDIANTLQGHTAGLIQQALQNRISLFGTGLNTISGATGMAGESQSMKNQFNLQNYENQVAAALASQKSSGGGLFGGLTGGIGGAIIGGLLAAPTGGMSLGMGALLGGLGGGALGALAPSGTGGQLMTAGASAFGSSLSSKSLPYSPGSTATNNPFADKTDWPTKYPYLFGNSLNN